MNSKSNTVFKFFKLDFDVTQILIAQDSVFCRPYQKTKLPLCNLLANEKNLNFENMALCYKLKLEENKMEKYLKL